MISHPGIRVVVAAVSLLALVGCASSDRAGGDPPTTQDPAPPASVVEVIGQGTVLQKGEDPPQLCLGAVAESYPPQCSGSEIIGWDWASVELWESANEVTWGAYAVQGDWDGETFTVTQPPMPLALYDPMPIDEPYLDESNPGHTADAELVRIQNEVTVEVPDHLGSWSANGYLFVQVVHDDGAIQDRFDIRYGPDVVVVNSALRAVGD